MGKSRLTNIAGACEVADHVRPAEDLGDVLEDAKAKAGAAKSAALPQASEAVSFRRQTSVWALTASMTSSAAKGRICSAALTMGR